jgi:hypothetical protein
MRRLVAGTGIRIGVTVGAILLLAACGESESGPVIGDPAQAAPSSAAGSGLSLAGLQQELADQLSQVEATQSDPGSGPLASEVDALINDQALLASERVADLQQLGHNEAVTLEGDLSSLIGDVQDDPALNGGERASIDDVIYQTRDQLQALDAKIAADTLVDVLRTDVLSVDSSTRVSGLIEPMVHLAIGAGDLLGQAQTLTTHASSLNSQIRSQAGLNEGQETQLIADLNNQVATMQTTGNEVFATALGLTPAGYPGNQSTLNSLKSELTAVEGGAALAGREDAANISTCLGDDTLSPPQTC